jgi:hypothetical protein
VPPMLNKFHKGITPFSKFAFTSEMIKLTQVELHRPTWESSGHRRLGGLHGSPLFQRHGKRTAGL